VDQTLVEKAERQLLRITDVASVAIDHSAGGIDAIHVLTHGRRRPKQVVRDVISSLRTSMNLSVDHKKISVVCPEPAPDTAAAAEAEPRTPARGREPRVRVRSVALRDFGYEGEAEVVLVHAGREVVGVARGAGSAARVERLLAVAAARALERFLDSRYRVDVADLRVVSLHGRRALVVVVSIVADRNEFQLLGAAWVRADLRRAAVYATLAAVNRVFARLERREYVEYDVGPTSPSSEVSEAVREDSH
jgi:hypothetical protein